jgi:hypothetical protein
MNRSTYLRNNARSAVTTFPAVCDEDGVRCRIAVDPCRSTACTDLPAPPHRRAHPDLVATADIPMLGGPGDEQALTVDLDDYGAPPSPVAAFVIEDSHPRIEGSYVLEPQAGAPGPPWVYVWVDR